MDKPGEFEEWAKSVPASVTADPLWRMKVYRLSLFLTRRAWQDVTQLSRDRRTIGLADQLYRAVGSIGANVAEGYSRQSGKDRARFYEYALGSARESRHWYYAAQDILSLPVVESRLAMIGEICKLLLTITPIERTRNLAEQPADYEIRSTQYEMLDVQEELEQTNDSGDFNHDQ